MVGSRFDANLQVPILAIPAAPWGDDAQMNERRKLDRRIGVRNGGYWVSSDLGSFREF